MRSVPLVAPRRLEMVEAPLPEGPGAGELLLRMRAVGLCGSDLHWWAEGRIHSTPARYPQILGHEPVGEVLAAGPGVENFRPGDLVSVEPSLTCGHCEFCIAGRHNLCVHARFQGGPEAPGFLRDYAVIPARNADRVPAGLGVHEATLVEPLAVWVHVYEMEPVRLGDTVAVLGAGSIGLLGIAMARQAGAELILACDRVPHRLELARRMGADEAVLSGEKNFLEAVMDRTRGRGVDAVFDAAGAPESIALGLKCLRPGGTLVLIGIPEPLEFSVDVHAALARELRIQAVRRSNHKGAQAAALLASGRIPTHLITHRLPLEKAQEGFEILHTYSDGVGKLIFDLDLKD